MSFFNHTTETGRVEVPKICVTFPVGYNAAQIDWLKDAFYRFGLRLSRQVDGTLIPVADGTEIALVPPEDAPEGDRKRYEDRTKAMREAAAKVAERAAKAKGTAPETAPEPAAEQPAEQAAEPAEPAPEPAAKPPKTRRARAG